MRSTVRRSRRSSSFSRVVVGVGCVGALLVVGMLLGSRPAEAQRRCASGQQYCARGPYAGQCRPPQTSCPVGSVRSPVGGCAACECPSGKILCGNTCEVPRSCTEFGKVTINQCTGACGACEVGYTLDPTSNRCVASAYLNVENVGDLRVRGMQQVGSSTFDLGTASGGQNLLYGIIRYVGAHAGDALLLLQTAFEGKAPEDRLRVDRDGTLTIAGELIAPVGVNAGVVRGIRLCIENDCRSRWPQSGTTTAGPTPVLLQPVTPGIPQAGHFNVQGTGIVQTLAVGGDARVGGNLRVGGGIEASGASVIISGAELRTRSGVISTDRPEYVELRAQNSGPSLSGRAKLRVGGLVVGDYTRTVDPSDVLVQGRLQVEGPTMLANATVGGAMSVAGTLRVDGATTLAGATASGNVNVGGNLSVAKGFTVGGKTALIDRIRRQRSCANTSSCFVPCENGWLVLGGGCSVDTAPLSTSAPNVNEQPEGWNCSTGQGGPTANIVATVICARASTK